MEAAVKYKKKHVKESVTPILTIFLVDDDLSYLYPLGFYLQRNTQHKVFCYTSGEECISNMHLAPDLIVLDYNLDPETKHTMDGLEALQRVKAMMPRTKVVMLSGRDSFQGVAESLKLGASSYIIKDMEALSALKKLIDKITNETH